MVDCTPLTTPPPSLGGSWGALTTADRYSLADLKLIRRAVRERWPVPDEVLLTVPRIGLYLVENARSERARLQAAKLLAEITEVQRCSV